MSGTDDRFVSRYHKALVLANKDRIENVKAKVASQWVKEWSQTLGGPIEDEQAFATAFERFLSEDLGFAGDVKVEAQGGELSIDVGSCGICPGNELLRHAGEPTFCPIIATGLQAIYRVLGRNATLLGVDKEGREVGFCTIRYKMIPKA